jgi:hypothetical protein
MFHFKTTAFARSFELLNGDFYFGLGSDNDDVRPETGDILRLAAPARRRSLAATCMVSPPIVFDADWS